MLEVKTSIAKVNEEKFDVVDDINNRMRRNNLIVKGIAEAGKEGYEESETIEKEFFAAHLGVQAGDIERAHRLGQRRAHVARPTIVIFLNFKSKMDVLRNAPELKKLENPKVWLEDFSPKLLLARKSFATSPKLLVVITKAINSASASFTCVKTYVGMSLAQIVSSKYPPDTNISQIIPQGNRTALA